MDNRVSMNSIFDGKDEYIITTNKIIKKEKQEIVKNKLDSFLEEFGAGGGGDIKNSSNNLPLLKQNSIVNTNNNFMLSKQSSMVSNYDIENPVKSPKNNL